ncbi:ATP-dependent nuclease [Algisphaera agarilytica]|uniref:Energy-coupling factor transporter ATP-binding protein EcfA2 n=1 Tax=Algisphaera agarilytica TaxID=1385975 RepID=A0A7X0LIR3_9BACT|nr:ATP-binding protein [Algisphaera agarilytica]MBB6428490.1 energy-coupling factor transporter ATP-binding protein EcfA2 [Algisphaera agarilytica]
MSQIDVLNYRSITKQSFALERFTPLVGYNNAGKSNILSAITWLIRPFSLGTGDFFDINQAVEVRGTVEGMSEQVLSNLGATHRKKIEPFCANGIIRFRTIHSEPGISAAKTAYEIRDLDVADEDDPDAWKNVSGIRQAIQAMFPEPIPIDAMDDAAEDVAKSKSGTTISKLLGLIVDPIRESQGDELSEILEGIRDRLEADGLQRPQEIIDFDTHANAQVSALFPGVEIAAHIPAPEISQIFKSGTLKVRDKGSDVWRDVVNMGHGAQRTIQMALICYLAAKNFDSSKPAPLLLIDEPELYLHPQGVEQVRQALVTLSETSFQIVFSTHSASMIQRDDVPNALVVRRDRLNGTRSKKRLADAISGVLQDNPSQTQTIFELSNASEVLFSDSVVLAEGKTEKRILPPLYERVTGKTLALAKKALVVPDGSGGVHKCSKVLDAISVPHKAVVDLDFAFRAENCEWLDNCYDEIQKCVAIFSDLCASNDFNLDGRGLPCKGGSMSASQAFSLLGSTQEAFSAIDSIHESLLQHNVWIWKKGCIEDYLGERGKNEKVWNRLAHDILNPQSDLTELLAHFDSLESFIEWIDA